VRPVVSNEATIGYFVFIAHSSLNALETPEGNGDNCSAIAASTMTLDTNLWYHVVGVHEPTNCVIKVYVNGFIFCGRMADCISSQSGVDEATCYVLLSGKVILCRELLKM
jgi:hypothetical protein